MGRGEAGRGETGTAVDPSATVGRLGGSGTSDPVTPPGGGIPPGAAGPRATGIPGAVRHFPRQTGTSLTDTLGRDRLGVRLISRSVDSEAPTPPEAPEQPGSVAAGPGGTGDR